MKHFSTKMLCRAGIVAALYVVFTYTFSSFAFGPIQVRPAEGLTLLPLLFAESVPALFVGCLIANLLSPFGIWDIAIGSLTTLISALCTYYIGKLIKNRSIKIVVGGIFPVLLNAIVLPLMWFLMDNTAGYWLNFLSIFGTQVIWVYAIGTPLFLFIERMRNKGVSVFCDHKAPKYIDDNAKKKDILDEPNGNGVSGDDNATENNERNEKS